MNRKPVTKEELCRIITSIDNSIYTSQSIDIGSLNRLQEILTEYLGFFEMRPGDGLNFWDEQHGWYDIEESQETEENPFCFYTEQGELDSWGNGKLYRGKTPGEARLKAMLAIYDWKHRNDK